MTDDKSKSDCWYRTYEPRRLSTEDVQVQDTLKTYEPHKSKEDRQIPKYNMKHFEHWTQIQCIDQPAFSHTFMFIRTNIIANSQV